MLTARAWYPGDVRMTPISDAPSVSAILAEAERLGFRAVSIIDASGGCDPVREIYRRIGDGGSWVCTYNAERDNE